MKNVVLMGSPNKKGQTMSIMKVIENGLDGEWVYFNPYRMNFKACIDCEYCHRNKGCCIDDDVQEMFSALEDADRVFVASPMYFGMISGPLLSLMSRLQYAFSNHVIMKSELPYKRKQGILVMTAAQDWFNMFSPCIDTAKFLFDHLNADPVANIFAAATDRIDAVKQETVLNNIDKTIKYLKYLEGEGNR